MKIVATADLHFDHPKSVPGAWRLAETLCAGHGGADVLVLAGDQCGPDLSVLCDCLRLFDAFRGRKLMIAGNHDLWSPHPDSFERFERHIPQLAADCGFTCLDAEPAVVGDVGFAGTIGWYDYSFRDEAIGVPLRFYEAKVGPGAARMFTEYRGLLQNTEDIGEQGRQVAIRWMDGRWVHLGMSDPQFTELLCGRLAGHLASIAPRVRTIVGVCHHVPFRRLCPPRPWRGIPKASWAFTTAFMGSERLGETFAAEPKLSRLLCGHTHLPRRRKIGRIEVIDIGSNYEQKQVVELEV
jgi:predicted phosphodiesterase